MKKLLIALFSIALLAGPAFADGSGISVNEKGSSGVCLAMDTSAAKTVVAGDPNRNGGVTLYSTVALNCWPGDPAGNAPATTPTTGAVGTGKGFPIAATQYIAILSGRAVAPMIGNSFSLPSGDRLDCISQTASGYVCSWSQQ